MASSRTPVNPENKGSIPKSRLNPTVCLGDWWLVKTKNDVQGKRLAVSGFTCRGQGISSSSPAKKNQAIRIFSSAPILKRYDDFTIETTDGVCVIFKGFINKARTQEHGFSSDVFNHFFFGFPLYWKEYEENCMGKESSSDDISGSKILRPLPEFESEQPHAENCENDLEFGSKIGEKRVRGKKADSLIIGSECNLSMPSIAPGGLEDESYSMGPTVESVISDSQVNAATGGVLFGCHLISKPTEKSPKDISSRSEVRVRTHSMNSLKTKQINDEKSAKVSDCNSEVAQVHGPTDKLKPSDVEGESVGVLRTPNRDSDLRKVKTEGCVIKAKRKSNSSSGMKNMNLVVYETPDREKDGACESFNRSRSGRLLIPSLEFWRNQKPIFDVDGRITGIEQGSLPKQSEGPVKRKSGQPRQGCFGESTM